MSQSILHGHGCKFGTVAPPIDRFAAPLAPRSSTQQSRSLRKPSEGLPPCAATPLRRRPSPSTTGGAGSDAQASFSSNKRSRAAQLFELNREGAYDTSAPAAPPPTPSTSDPSGTGDDSAFLDDGWGVVAVVAPRAAAAVTKPAAKRDKKQDKQNRKQQLQSAAVLAAGGTAAVRGGSQGVSATPFFEKNSEAGMTGLTLLQARLIEEGRLEHAADRKAEVAAEAAARRNWRMQTVRRKRDWVDADDLDPGEGEVEEVPWDAFEGDTGAASNNNNRNKAKQQHYFELNLEADGSAEVVEYDEEGRIKARRAPGAAVDVGRRSRADDDDDPLAFLADLEDEGEDGDAMAEGDEDDDGVDEVYGRRVASGAAAGSSRRSHMNGSAGGDTYDDDGDDGEGGHRRRREPLLGEDMLADEEFEWGLEELRPVGQPSLLQELGIVKTKAPKRQKQRTSAAVVATQQHRQNGQAANGPFQRAGAKSKSSGKQSTSVAVAPQYDDDDQDEDDEYEPDVNVAWGGSGGASGIDMDQQEELLSRLFKPHKVKELMAHQKAADEALAALKRKTSGRQMLESKTHSRMRIIAGSAAGRQLASSKGDMTRPMMEKVRQAIFNIMQSQAGSSGGLPEGSRWLDCFAGTGSVGLEALSRGCAECHFIELDPWVCRKILSRNISTCGFQRRSAVHTMKAEDFLRKSIELPRFAGGPFDFLSVCPPYLVVSYPELMDLLNRSPLLHDRSIVLVEFPKQLSHQMPETLGSLVTVRDRKYGRTYIRVYGPADGPKDATEGAQEEGFSSNQDDEGEELLL